MDTVRLLIVNIGSKFLGYVIQYAAISVYICNNLVCGHFNSSLLLDWQF